MFARVCTKFVLQPNNIRTQQQIFSSVSSNIQLTSCSLLTHNYLFSSSSSSQTNESNLNNVYSTKSVPCVTSLLPLDQPIPLLNNSNNSQYLESISYTTTKSFSKGGGSTSNTSSSQSSSGESDAQIQEPKIESPHPPDKIDPYDMTPRQMIKELDRFVIGQSLAKRAVAIAWRSRWRRRNLPEHFKPEVTPKNILMIGPTGCGKTEVARRLAKLSASPFIKVEATKFTEVGYVGKDVSSIIEDLVAQAANLVKERKKKQLEEKLKKSVDDKLLHALVGKMEGTELSYWKKNLEKGALEEINVDIEVPKDPDISSLFGTMSSRKHPYLILSGAEQRYEKKTYTIKRARDILLDQELKKQLSDTDLAQQAIELCENDGIVFIDEIDKICGPRDAHRSERRVSQEGVQRDLLPLIEGCSIQVPNYGKINTDHILFICAGAFHDSKPSDLMPEFQGRLPVRVELKPLTLEDMHQILTKREYNLISQQIELLKTEECNVKFTDEAVLEIANIAVECNDRIENIGARRLITVIEKVMEDINVEASEKTITEFVIDKNYVRSHIGDILKGEDHEKFIL